MPCFYCFHVWVPIARLSRRNVYLVLLFYIYVNVPPGHGIPALYSLVIPADNDVLTLVNWGSPLSAPAQVLLAVDLYDFLALSFALSWIPPKVLPLQILVIHIVRSIFWSISARFACCILLLVISVYILSYLFL
jgi:hypothetical protein